MDNFRQHGKPAVGVAIPVARLEIEALLPAQDLYDLVLRDHVIQPCTGDGQQAPLISNPAGMIQEMTDGYLFLQIGEPGQVFMDVVIQLQFSLPGQQYDGKSSELLGHGGHMKNGGRRVGYIIFKIGHAIALAEDERIIPYNACYAAGASGNIPFFKKMIDLFKDAVGQRLAIRIPTDRKYKKQEEKERFHNDEIISKSTKKD